MKATPSFLILTFFSFFFNSAYSQLKTTKVEDINALKALFTYHPDRAPRISAHRGGSYLGYPENCIATFELVLKYVPALIECDVRMTRDGVLVMMHDETLHRTTTGKGKVSEHSWNDIRKLLLLDSEGNITPYKVPAFSEALQWAVGKAVLTVAVRQGVPFEKVVRTIEEANAAAYAMVITYQVEDAKKVHQLNPDLMISVPIRNEDELRRVQESGIPLENLVAFVGSSEPREEFYDLLHSKGLSCILGTMGNLDNKAIARGEKVYIDLLQNGADILSTDRPVEVANILEKVIVEQVDQRVDG